MQGVCFSAAIESLGLEGDLQLTPPLGALAEIEGLLRAAQARAALGAAAALAADQQGFAFANQVGDAEQRLLGVLFHQGDAPTAAGQGLDLGCGIDQQTAARAEEGESARWAVAHVDAQDQGPLRHIAVFQRHEGLARALAAQGIAYAGDKAEALRSPQQQRRGAGAREVMQGLRARCEFDERGDGLAVAAPAGQVGHINGIRAAVAAEHDQRIDAAAFERGVERITRLEGEGGQHQAVAFLRAQPALLRHDDGDGFIDHLDLGHGALLGLNEGAAVVAELFGVGLDLADDPPGHGFFVGEQFLQFGSFSALGGEFLVDADGFQPRELAQPHVEDVVGLQLGEIEARHQRRPGIVAVADGLDHLVEIEQHLLPTFEDMDARVHLFQAML